MSSRKRATIVSALPQKRRRRLKFELKRTPWRDCFELERVGAQLCIILDENTLSDNLGEVDEALSTCQIWKARSNDSLPHAIDVSFHLTAALYKDYTGQLSNHDVRVTLANTLLRGINGLADTLQNLRREACSVMFLCDQLGIPSWLVDLRHESAHNQLPSLPVLRLAAKTLLGYLKDRYWDEVTSKREELRTKAMVLLEMYSNATNCETAILDAIQKNDLDIPAVEMDVKAPDAAKTTTTNFEDGDGYGFYAWSGSNTNRYAALKEPERPKKKKKEENEAEVDNKTSKKRNATQKHPSTPIKIAKAYVSEIPVDIGLQVAISSLLWGSADESSVGYLLAFNETSGVCMEHHYDRYKPLLVVLCKAWPGFLSMLLKHIVECVLLALDHNTEEAVSSEANSRISILSSWFKFLLSNEFMIYMGFSDDDKLLFEKKRSEWTLEEKHAMEGASKYEKLPDLPLNSLCDRLEEKTKGSADQIQKHILDILGQNRKSLSVIRLFKERCHPDKVADEGGSDLIDGDRSREDGQDHGILPKEMDPIPAQVHNAMPEDKPASVRPQKVVWERVETWEPCDIGSLPGFLV